MHCGSSDARVGNVPMSENLALALGISTPSGARLTGMRPGRARLEMVMLEVKFDWCSMARYINAG